MRKPRNTHSLRVVLCGALVGFIALSTAPAGAGEVDSNKEAYKRPRQIPFPAENPFTPEKAALGKALFFDPRLSGAQNMNCASCHNPSFGWEVPVKTAVGSLNAPLSRQAPTVENVAWGHVFFWDGRAASLEEQARGPIESEAEMNLPLSEAKARLEAIADYKTWFARIFPNEGLTEQNILRAIATYERTVVSGTSPFDAWIEGDDTAISSGAKRGFELFTGKARCSACHSGWSLTDGKFHDIGTSTNDLGRGELEKSVTDAQYAFKTPGLRDIALRAPYMHNGELASLEDVMMHYVGGGIERPSRSPLMQPLNLTSEEIADLVSFMHSLTAKKSDVSLPILPN